MKLFPRGSDFQPHPVYLSANGNLGSCPGINNGDLQTLPCNYGEGNWKDQDWKCEYASSAQPSRCINTVGQRFAGAAGKKTGRSWLKTEASVVFSVSVNWSQSQWWDISACTSLRCLSPHSSPQVQNSPYSLSQHFWAVFCVGNSVPAAASERKCSLGRSRWAVDTSLVCSPYQYWEISSIHGALARAKLWWQQTEMLRKLAEVLVL